MKRQMTGAQMVMEALADQGVRHVFGYPGGAVLPIYDELCQQDKVGHILVRHEQGRATPRKAMPARPASPAWCWSPQVPVPPTWSPR